MHPWPGNLKAGDGSRGPENYDKNECFWNIFQRSKSRVEPPANFDKMSTYEAFSSDLEAGTWRGSKSSRHHLPTQRQLPNNVQDDERRVLNVLQESIL